MPLRTMMLFIKVSIVCVVCNYFMVISVFAGPKIRILLGDVASPFGQQLASELPIVAKKYNIDVAIYSPSVAENVPEMEELLLSWQSTAGYDGIVVACGIGASRLGKAAEPYTSRGLPVISILGRMRRGIARSSILVDENTLIAYAVDCSVEHLRGDDQITFLRSSTNEGRMNDRERLFINGIRAQLPDIRIRAGIFLNIEGSTPENQARVLLDTYPATNLVYSPYTAATMAMVRTIHERGLSGKIHHIGIGAGTSPELLGAVKTGDLDALIAISPHDIAEKVIDTMNDTLSGKVVPEIIYSHVEVITKTSIQNIGK
ncbi:MAG: substrate-binding domain-containing protein [Nibricoccus sp.]